MFVFIQNSNTTKTFIYSRLFVELLFWLVFLCIFVNSQFIHRQKMKSVWNWSVIICSASKLLWFDREILKFLLFVFYCLPLLDLMIFRPMSIGLREEGALARPQFLLVVVNKAWISPPVVVKKFQSSYLPLFATLIS